MRVAKRKVIITGRKSFVGHAVVSEPSDGDDGMTKQHDDEGESSMRNGVRWIADVIYRSQEVGSVDVRHHLLELEELQAIVEAGPDWHSIEKIEITLARNDGVPVMTLEATAAKSRLPCQFVAELPEDAGWTPHPSGDGFIIVHPEHPRYWVMCGRRPCVKC